MSQIIKIENVNLWYDKGKPSVEVHALKNINIGIEKGDYVAFFGPSGCGKTTMLYAISGIDRFQEGKILINDRDISGLSNQELAIFRQTGIGIVFQQFNLVPSLNVLKNVALPMLFVGVSSEKAEAEARKLIERLDLTKYIDRYPYELSGGQQQRVGIARALANNPPIVIADEPLGNLDSTNAQMVLGILKDLNEKDGRTVIMVTHEVWSLRDAKTIFHMKDGQITDVEKVKKVDKPKTIDSQTNPVSVEIAPVITLLGDNPMSVTIGSEFIDPGASASDAVDGNCEILVAGEVNTNILGSYTITYTSNNKSGNVSLVTRTVNVVLAPEYDIISISGPNGKITPLGITTVKTNTDQTYEIIPDEGYVIDTLTVDGINLAVVPKYTFVNVVASHVISVTFKNTPDRIPPVITLLGDNPMSVTIGSEFIDPGASASDAVDGKCEVTVNKNINTNALGSYAVNYTAMDKSGNVSLVTRTVNVVLAPEYDIISISGPNGKITPLGITTVKTNTDQTYEIIPDEGYVIDTLTVDGINLAVVPKYTFVNVVASHNISVKFIKIVKDEETQEENISTRVLANFLLSGCSMEEILRFESLVKDKIEEKITEKEFFDFLNKSFKEGGIGLRRKKSEKIVDFLESVLEKREEIKKIYNILEKDIESSIIDEVCGIRSWLVEDYIGDLSQEKIEALDQAISDRIRNFISSQEFVEVLDLSNNKFGVGFSLRNSQLMSEKLELILGTKRLK